MVDTKLVLTFVILLLLAAGLGNLYFESDQLVNMFMYEQQSKHKLETGSIFHNSESSSRHDSAIVVTSFEHQIHNQTHSTVPGTSVPIVVDHPDSSSSNQTCIERALKGHHELLLGLYRHASKWKYPPQLKSPYARSTFFKDIITERSQRNHFDYLSDVEFKSWSEANEYYEKNRKSIKRKAVVIKIAHSADICCVFRGNHSVPFKYILLGPFGDSDNWSPTSWSNPWEKGRDFIGLKNYLRKNCAKSTCASPTVRDKVTLKDLCDFANNPQLALWITFQQGFLHPKVYSIPAGVKGGIHSSYNVIKSLFIDQVKGYHPISRKVVSSGKAAYMYCDLLNTEKERDSCLKYAASRGNETDYPATPYMKERLMELTFTAADLKISFPYPKPHFKSDVEASPRQRFLDVLQARFDNLTSSGIYCDQSKSCKLQLAHFVWRVGRSKFLPSPPGMGLDCHRHYDSLLIGTVPIIEKGGIDDIWRYLPVYLVDNIADLFNYTDEKLLNKYAEIVCSRSNKQYDLLTWSYWENFINQTSYDPDAVFRYPSYNYHRYGNESKSNPNVLCT